MKKIRLTESEFHSLIRKMVLEAQKEMSEMDYSDEEMDYSEEMEEGFDDFIQGAKKNVRKFVKGHGSEEEREEKKRRFMQMLDDMEAEGESDPGLYWGDIKDKRKHLEKSAEENDYLGDIDIRGDRDRYVKYRPGKKGFEKLASGYGASQGSTIYERRRRQ
jgi:hypothetical protein